MSSHTAGRIPRAPHQVAKFQVAQTAQCSGGAYITCFVPLGLLDTHLKEVDNTLTDPRRGQHDQCQTMDWVGLQ